MAIDVLKAAKHLCKESNWSLNNLQVQKILYICHVLYYGQEKEPLIEGEFQAWDYGPVHPDLYHFLKYYGADPVPELAFDEVEDLKYIDHEKELKMIYNGAKAFSFDSGPKLVAITHWDEGAWKKNYKSGIKYIPLPKNDILQEYQNYKLKIIKSIRNLKNI